MNIIQFKDVNLGGIADSIYSGIKNSMYRMVGLDIHSTPSLVRVNQKMSKYSGIIIDEYCKFSIDCSNGIKYWFSSVSGKVWQDKAGTITLVYTTDNWTSFAGVFATGTTITVPTDLTAIFTNGKLVKWQKADGTTKAGTVSSSSYSSPNTTITLGSGSTVETGDKLFNYNGTAGTDVATLGAYEYQGNLYWATRYKLHKIATTSCDGASAWTTNAFPAWATFTNGNANYHPMTEVNLVLYIADGNIVAQVDAGVFSANALDISSNYVITALGKMGTYLLVGGSIPYVNQSEIFSWNTYSTAFQTSDTVPERTIHSFIYDDNYIYVNAGFSGSIYAFNGSQLQFYKRIPGTYSSTKTCIVNPNASAIYKGSIPIFGVSNNVGDACDQGVWSLGRYSLNYPSVFNLEFPTSNVDSSGYNILTGIEIGSLMVSGVDIYMSWKRTSTVTMTIADPGVVTLASHGLTNGEAVYFTTTGALPTGVTASTVYYARGVDANTFNLYDTSAHAVTGGATGRVATSGTQSGVHSMITVGIDKLDYSNKIVHPFFETRVIAPDRNSLQSYSKFKIDYQSLPSGTSIVIKTKADHATDYSDTTELVDTMRKTVYTDSDRLEAKSLQVRVECISSSNDAPTIEELDIMLS